MKSIELSVWTPAHAAQLLLNPPKNKARQITIECPLGEDVVIELVRRCASPRLRRLDLIGVSLGSGSTWRKVLAPFETFQDLGITDAFESGAHALEWFEALRFRRLTSLRLERVPFANVSEAMSTRVLTRLAPTLVELTLHDCGLDGHRVTTLLRGLRLRFLGLGANSLGLEGLRHVVASTDIAALTELALPHCSLGDEGMKWVAFWLAGRPLKHVFLEDNGITPRGASEIGHRWRSNLRGALLLGENPLGVDGISQLAPALRAISRLNFDEVGLDRAAMKVLSGQRLPRLRELELEYNEMGDSAARVIATAPWLAQLKELSLHGNDLSAKSVRPIVEGAAKSCSIMVNPGSRVSKRTLESLRKRNKGLL